MNDDQKTDQTNLVRSDIQALTRRSTKLVRRGLEALRGKQRENLSMQDLDQMWRNVLAKEFLAQMQSAPKLSPEQKRQLVEENRRKVEELVKQRNASMKTGEDGDERRSEK